MVEPVHWFNQWKPMETNGNPGSTNGNQ